MNDQLDMFTQRSTPRPARGPAQSDAVILSLGKDLSLKADIARAVWWCSRPKAGQNAWKPVTDDDITTWLEWTRNMLVRT